MRKSCIIKNQNDRTVRQAQRKKEIQENSDLRKQHNKEKADWIQKILEYDRKITELEKYEADNKNLTARVRLKEANLQLQKTTINRIRTKWLIEKLIQEIESESSVNSNNSFSFNLEGLLLGTVAEDIKYEGDQEWDIKKIKAAIINCLRGKLNKNGKHSNFDLIEKIIKKVQPIS